MTQFLVLAQVLVEKGFLNEVIKGLDDLAQPTRQEKGCVRYEIYHNPTDENDILVHEIWQTKEHWLAHLETDHLLTFKKRCSAQEGAVERG